MTPDLTPHIPHICRWAKRRAEERRRFQTYIEDLRRQYADQIQVDQERLAEALPDEFLTAF